MSCPTDPVRVGIGDDRKSWTTLETSPSIQEIPQIASQTGVGSRAIGTGIRTLVTSVISDVVVVRVWTDVHTDLIDRIPIQRQRTLLNAVSCTVLPKSIMTQYRFGSIWTLTYALLNLV